MARPAGAVLPRREPAVSPIVEPGRNCWRVDRAREFSCIQDAADYFRLVRQAILQAQKTIFILGWDIRAHTDLVPDGKPGDGPTRLDKLLVYVAKRRRELSCCILIWDYGALYTLERDPWTRWRLGWRSPRNVHFAFDDHHPIGASHHQKIVVVDDTLAFCGGGIDLTGHRWDRSAHRVEEPARVTSEGVRYEPYHEVQAMVSGPAARSLGILARDRWRAADADRMPPLEPADRDLWPSDRPADLTDVDVAIARTMPPSDEQASVRECETLFLDSIARARETIYIETQYFTSSTLGEALAARLQEPSGPEVIIVTPKECQGRLEKQTMGTFRDRVFRTVIEADQYKRLRIVYPLASRARDVSTFVHSKVMVIDDELVRIGSANFAQRSLGMDTECDLAVEAGGDRRVQTGIRQIRDRLLADHLHLAADDVARGIEREGLVRALIDSRETAEHTLVRVALPQKPEPTSEVLRAVADPVEPLTFGSSAEPLIPSVDVATGRSPLRVWILPAVALMAAAAVIWPEFPVLEDALRAIPQSRTSLWIGGGIFLLAGLLLVPLELLIIVAGLFFGAFRGGIVAMIGSIAAAIAGYVAGRVIGPAGLPNWISRQSYRTLRQLRAQGIVGLTVLRLAAVATAGSINLLCGAGRVPFGTYLVATHAALVPTIAVLGGLGALLRDTLRSSSIERAAMTMGAALLLMALATVLRTIFLIRQFAPSVSRQREGAEFG